MSLINIDQISEETKKRITEILNHESFTKEKVNLCSILIEAIREWADSIVNYIELRS